MASVFASIAKRSLIFLLMLGPALLGTIAHYPAYRLGGYLATRFSRDSEDIISTIKIISAMLLFPLTWLVLAVASYVACGWLRGSLKSWISRSRAYACLRSSWLEGDSSFGCWRSVRQLETRSSHWAKKVRLQVSSG
jgi:hypothetical protein